MIEWLFSGDIWSQVARITGLLFLVFAGITGLGILAGLFIEVGMDGEQAERLTDQ